MKLKKEFIIYNTDDTQIMVSTDTKLFSGIVRSNETAAFIMDCLKGDTTIKEIVEKMLKEYSAPKEEIEKDTQKVIDILRKINAIDE